MMLSSMINTSIREMALSKKNNHGFKNFSPGEDKNKKIKEEKLNKLRGSSNSMMRSFKDAGGEELFDEAQKSDGNSE